jgi:DNA repair exonuclease SbcCD ATPase subunit/DNA repair exonuclease SbcCD nuclease subunit
MKQIIHISDIHIRYGDKKSCRYEEYCIVFDNLMKSIIHKIEFNDLKYEDFVIIVTGDIFHNKNIVGNYGLELYNMLINGLSNIGRTIIFHGNHDRSQNEISQPSLISSTIQTKSLTILKKTQSFTIDNVGFSYVNIDDTLDALSTVGRINKLPPFPDIEKEVQYKIALFHGTFVSAKLYNGTEIPESNCASSYPFSWISHFDYALLGDIHLRQQGINKNVLWGYSGSLLQQNYGEDIVEHGYMIWDLEKRSIENVNVYNPYGYINIMIKNNNIFLRNNGKYTDKLDCFISGNEDYFPKNIEIRTFSAFNCDNTKELYSIFNKHNISFTILGNKLNTNDKIKSTIVEKVDNNDIIHINKDTFIEYLKKYIPSKYYDKASDIIKNLNVLLFNIDNCPCDLIDESLKKNKEISLLIKACNLNDNVKAKHPFTIEYLEWENLYCYEGGNSINFAEAINSTLLICGNNGTGKSAIYDIITLAIWGVITKDKQNSLSKNGIINYKHKTAYTIIDISVDGVKYQIKRKYSIQSDIKSANKSNIEIYKYDNGKKELIKKNNACNEFIKLQFNTLDDFLTCSMITQVVDNDILKMDYKECTAIIDKASNINEIYELFNLFKVCLNKYKDFKKTIDNKTQVYQHILATTEVNDDNEEDLVIELRDLDEKYSELMKINNSITIDILDKKYKDLKNIKSVEKEITDIEYDDYTTRLNELKVYFKKFDYTHIQENALKYDVDTVIPEKIEKPCEYSIIKEEQLFLSKYVKPVIIPVNKICDIEIQYKEILEKINDLNEEKPVFGKNKIREINEIVYEIEKIFGEDNPINDLKDFLSNNIGIASSSNSNNSSDISYKYYLELLSDNDKIAKSIETGYEYINDCDNNISKQQNKRGLLTIYPIPQNIQKEEKNYIDITDDYDEYKNKLLEYEIILNDYYKSLEDIDIINIKIEKYLNELNTLKNNEEYGYDPCCKYCCARSWVIRMKELENIIINNKTELDNQYDKIYNREDVDYILIYNDYNILKEKILIHELRVEWFNYDKYISYEKNISRETEVNIQNKNEMMIKITENNKKITDNTCLINSFNKHSHILYTEYDNTLQYDKYIVWKDKYTGMNILKNKIETDIKITKDYQEYITYIKPRIKNLNILIYNYNEWEKYDNIINIKLSHEYILINDKINKQEEYYKYIKYKDINVSINKKKAVLEEIDICSLDIKTKSDNITKILTLKEYNKKNNDNYEYYLKENIKITETIDILDIIIDNFKTYKIDLYENHILKKLMIKTNSYIKLLCHENTKNFELDFMINEHKDIIHINWLIHNTCSDNTIKQVISINQASGFQKFVISLALRMSLYSNTQTEQLFIDEGFTACDNQNLSLVPSFLKKLLNTFSCIVIVSHIDIIKDSADIIVNIEYDKNTKTSHIKL